MPDAAFDATADALTRRALGALPPDRPRGRADLARLAPPVAHLLASRLDAAAEPPAHRFVDADAPAVRAARGAYVEAARGAARFPADAWEGELGRAVVLALAHLVRPAETLAAAAFEDAHGPVAVAEIWARIRAFGPYPYLPEIAERYAERKAVDALDRAGLEQLLRRIDRRMVSAFGPSEWTTLLGPLFELAGPVGEPEGTVAAPLLRDLFEARGAPALAAVFADLDAVGPEALRERLEATLGPSAAPPPAGPTVVDEPPALEAPPLPPVAEGVRPPVVGSAFGAPEADDADSEVLGPPRPVGSAPASDPTPDAPDTDDGDPGADAPDPMAAVRDALAEPVDDARFEDDDGRAAPADLALIFPTHDAPDAGSPDNASEAEDDAPPASPAPQPTAPPDLDGHAGPPPPPPAPPRPAADDDEPLWKRLAREQGVDPDPPAPPPDEDEPLWRRFAKSDLAAKLPDPPAPAPPSAPSPASASAAEPSASPELDVLERRVLGIVSADRRAAFVADLFEGSPGAYHRTLDQLDRAPTYTEATRVFSAEVLRRHRVDPYTDAAVAFIDAVQERFEGR